MAIRPTYIQWKLLKMLTGTRPMAILAVMSVMTVAMGSWLGHLAGVGATPAMNAECRNCSNGQGGDCRRRLIVRVIGICTR